MTTMPPPNYRAVCPHCANLTGVTLCSVTLYGGTVTVYLGCSCCGHRFSDLAVDEWSPDSTGITAPGDLRFVVH
jgi:C4-type Zn-finger protein